MTIRDIQAHLERALGIELSHQTISNITDAVAEEVLAWQARPVYPILYLDAYADTHIFRHYKPLLHQPLRSAKHLHIWPYRPHVRAIIHKSGALALLRW